MSYANTLTTALNSAVISRPEKESAVARTSTHNGMPTIIFKAREYYGLMAEECKITIVGRFLKSRPQIDKIRSQFKEKNALKGSVQIGVYDNYNVFLDFSNDDDFEMVRYKRMIEIEGLQMWFQKWTPDFKPEEDLPIATVWALLPELSFHMHTWEYTRQIIAPVGIPLHLDIATKTKTRPSMAKVRVEIDLLKPLQKNIWVGLEDENYPLRGFEQKIEREHAPKYCIHCKKIGHDIVNCWVFEKKRQMEKKEEEQKGAESSNKQKENNDIEGKKYGEEGEWEIPNNKRNRQRRQNANKIEQKFEKRKGDQNEVQEKKHTGEEQNNGKDGAQEQSVDRNIEHEKVARGS